MRFTIDVLGTELFEIRVNHFDRHDTPPLGFTTAIEGDE